MLKRCFVLVDARHGLIGTDETMLDELDRAAQLYQIVLTKVDAVAAAALPALVEKTTEQLKTHPAAYGDILITSSQTGYGISALRSVIFGLLKN